MLYVSISEGNIKLGDIPSVSMVPGIACKPGVPCFGGGCYAVKSCRCYPTTGRAYACNYVMATHMTPVYFNQINDWLVKHKPEYFRWHVGGDMLDQDYLDRVFETCRKHPKTKFLAFTKRAELCFDKQPKNLSVVYSQWPGMPTTVEGRARSWMRDLAKPDTRIPKNAIDCPGSCVTCKLCWNLKKNQSVVFTKH